MNVRFACPHCHYPARVDLTSATEWQCASCGQRRRLATPGSDLPACVVCGNTEIYKKKDFPHWLGMGILVAACGASLITYGLYEKWLTWAILIGSALFDGLLFLWVGDALVCYRCHAHYGGFAAGAAHQPFELTIGERFRQERLRQEQMGTTPPATNQAP